MNGILALQSCETLVGVRIRDSHGRNIISDKPAELLSHIAERQQLGYFMVTWDLTAFLTPIFRLLPPEVVTKLNNGERAIWPPYRLFYAVGKGKFFGINYKKRSHVQGNIFNENTFDINIYELKTFFAGEPQPQGADAVAQKGMELLQTLESMGMRPTKLTSPAAIYEETTLRRLPIPNVYTMPESSIPMLEWCWNSIREWRSVYQIGIWPEGKAHDYDLSSAYPSEIARLPNIAKADFIHTDGEIPPDATWGIMKGVVTITADVSPVVSDDGTCRTGTYPTLLPVEEWDCIRRHGIGDFIPSEGWFIRVPPVSSYGHAPSLPCLFGYSMRHLYEYRSATNTLKSDIAKAMSVSVWGKFQEMHGDKYGDFWNSIYACMVASRVRIRDCDFIYDNGLNNDLISVTVDGCLASRLVDAPTGKAFGQWRLNPPSPVMVLTSSNQWAGDKRPNGKDVNQMIGEVKAHPAAKHFGGIHLAMLEHDRYFERLPKNGRDLLANTYRSIPFTTPAETKNPQA